MPTVSKSFTPSDIFQGPADIWLGIGAPPSAVPPVEGTNTLTLDANGYPPDSNTTGGILTAGPGTTGAGGSGYAVGDLLEITQAGAASGLVRVATVSSGAILTVTVERRGSGYSAANNLAITARSGAGTGATIQVLTIQAGINLGLTDGPASLSINPKFQEIRADQHAAPVDAAFVSLACEIDFTLKESNLNNFERYFAGFSSAAYFNLALGATNPAADLLQIGSARTSRSRTSSLMLISPARDAASKWMYLLAYSCYLKSAIPMTLDRKKENVMKLKFGCIADVSRIVQDQVLQIVRMN